MKENSKLLIVFFALLSFQFITSQATSVQIDSLKQELEIYPNKDASKLNILFSLIHEIYDVDIKEAQKLLEECKEIAQEFNIERAMAQVYYYKGLIEGGRSNNAKAIEYYVKAMEIYKKNKEDRGTSYCLNLIGTAYYDQSNYSEAILYYEESLALDKKNDDLRGISACYTNLGNVYADKGSYDEAIEYYLKSKIIKEEIKDDSGVIKLYANIGEVYNEQGNYPKALEYLNNALFIYESNNYTFSINYLLSFLGEVYKKYGDFDKALSCYTKGIKRSKKLGYKKVTSNYLNEMGSLYVDQLKNHKALPFFIEALALNREIENKEGIVKNLCNIGSIQILDEEYNKGIENYKDALAISRELDYKAGVLESYLGMALILEKKKRYNNSLNNALKGQKLAVELGFIEQQMKASELLSKTYSSLGNHKEAYKNYQQFKRLNDSIFNKENIRKIAEVEYEYKYKQELESANFRESKLNERVAETSNELQETKQNFLIGIIIFLIIGILMGVRVFSLKLKNVKSINENILMEQKLLRSQMTPHFIFNALSVLQGIILNKEEKKAEKYLSKFSKLLRITLENSRDKIVLLEKELEAVENYILVQSLGADTPINYLIKKPENINEQDILIPPMLIQPFVENAIEHGFTEEQIDKKIEINIQYVKEKLVCTILDNGVGIDAKKESNNTNKKSLAISITSERLKMLSKEFNVTTNITIRDRNYINEKGTEVIVVLPYKIIKND